jgi:hypothetical protein
MIAGSGDRSTSFSLPSQWRRCTGAKCLTLALLSNRFLGGLDERLHVSSTTVNTAVNIGVVV